MTGRLADDERGLADAAFSAVAGFSASEEATLQPYKLPDDGRLCFAVTDCMSTSVGGFDGRLAARCLLVLPALRALPALSALAAFIADNSTSSQHATTSTTRLGYARFFTQFRSTFRSTSCP